MPFAKCCVGIDVTQDDAWEAVRKVVATRNVDILILNAGILVRDSIADLSEQRDNLLEQVGLLDPQPLVARANPIGRHAQQMGSLCPSAAVPRERPRAAACGRRAAGPAAARLEGESETQPVLVHFPCVQWLCGLPARCQTIAANDIATAAIPVNTSSAVIAGSVCLLKDEQCVSAAAQRFKLWLQNEQGSAKHGGHVPGKRPATGRHRRDAAASRRSRDGPLRSVSQVPTR